MDNLRRFNVLLEDGSLIKDCNVFSNFGNARNIRDVKNALSKESRIIVNNEYVRRQVVSAKNVYEVEII